MPSMVPSVIRCSDLRGSLPVSHALNTISSPFAFRSDVPGSVYTTWYAILPSGPELLYAVTVAPGFGYFSCETPTCPCGNKTLTARSGVTNTCHPGGGFPTPESGGW